MEKGFAASASQSYLDNASTTPLHSRVLEAMLPYFTQFYANPSGLHSAGRDVRKAVEDAREIIASHINAHPKEIIFTSCATEANNLAILGTAFALKEKGRHLITSEIEHLSVLKPFRALQANGFEVTYIPVDPFGRIQMEQLERSIRPDTILISVMFANNEVSTIQPIDKIAELAKAKGVILHTDAVQAVGKLRLDVKKLGVDMLSISGHKIHGPKGIGALYLRKHTPIEPIIVGGDHEFQRRAGTENVPGIIGLAEAIKLVHEDLQTKVANMQRLRQRLWKGIMDKIDRVHYNGHPQDCLPNILNISFEGVEGEAIVLSLDAEAIYTSTGSACASESMEPSHVLAAMGLSRELSLGAVRFSLGLQTTQQEIDLTLSKLPGIIERLRRLSPLYKPQALTR